MTEIDFKIYKINELNKCKVDIKEARYLKDFGLSFNIKGYFEEDNYEIDFIARKNKKVVFRLRNKKHRLNNRVCAFSCLTPLL